MSCAAAGMTDALLRPEHTGSSIAQSHMFEIGDALRFVHDGTSLSETVNILR